MKTSATRKRKIMDFNESYKDFSVALFIMVLDTRERQSHLVTVGGVEFAQKAWQERWSVMGRGMILQVQAY